MRDFLRLENPISFFVLESLFEKILVSFKKEIPSLTELVLVFFDYAIESPSEVLDSYKHIKGKHLLDSFQSTLILLIQDDSKDELEESYSPFLQFIQFARSFV